MPISFFSQTSHRDNWGGRGTRGSMTSFSSWLSMTVSGCSSNEFVGHHEVGIPCPGGCGYQVTWHPTHCCALCQQGVGHGSRCERKQVIVEKQSSLVSRLCCLRFRDPDAENEYQQSRMAWLMNGTHNGQFWRYKAQAAFFLLTVPLFNNGFEGSIRRHIHAFVSLTMSFLCGLYVICLQRCGASAAPCYDTFVSVICIACQITAGLTQTRLAYCLDGDQRQSDAKMHYWVDTLDVLGICGALSASGFVMQKNDPLILAIAVVCIIINIIVSALGSSSAFEDITLIDVMSIVLPNLIILVLGVCWAVTTRRESIRDRASFQSTYAESAKDKLMQTHRRNRTLLRSQMVQEAYA